MSAHAQAPYTGGQGGAYAKASAVYVHGDPAIPDTVEIYPSLLHRGETLNIEAIELHNKLDVLVSDLYGHLRMRKTFWIVKGKYAITLSTEELPSGVYLVEVRRDGRVFVQKIIVLEE